MKSLLRFPSPRQPQRKLERLRLTKFQQVSHQWRMGNSGVGKSNLARQDLLRHCRAGWPAVVVDLENEHLRKFWKKGDSIINVADNRCVFYDIQKEHDGNMLTCLPYAENLLSRGKGDDMSKNQIFHKWAKNVLAAVLALKNPTAEELSEYLANMEVLQKILAHTAYASMLPEKANDQRAGVEGMLSLLATALGMLPRSPRGRERFAVRQWVRQPKGRVWITGHADTNKSVVPFYSGLMSLFLRGAMSQEGEGGILFFYDETHGMDYIEALPDAYTNMRKRGNMVIAGFQNPNQPADIYGEKAWETMWSQAGTRMIFAVGGKEAKAISEQFGEVTYVRAEESETQGDGLFAPKKVSVQCRVHTEPRVPAHQIMGASNLDAWLLQRGFRGGQSGRLVAVPFRVPVITLPDVTQPFIPRKMDGVYVYEKVEEQQSAPTPAAEDLGPPLAEEYAKYERAQAAQKAGKSKASPKKTASSKKTASKKGAPRPQESSPLNATQRHNLGVFQALDGDPVGRALVRKDNSPAAKTAEEEEENPFAD
jgi:Type IV secretion-system coupling protein DNA-binding domain